MKHVDVAGVRHPDLRQLTERNLIIFSGLNNSFVIRVPEMCRQILGKIKQHLINKVTHTRFTTCANFDGGSSGFPSNTPRARLAAHSDECQEKTIFRV
jgi:hypothetical protein